MAALGLVPWGTGGLWAQPVREQERVAAPAPDEEAAAAAAQPRAGEDGDEAAGGGAERPLLREAGEGAREHGKGQVRVGR